MTRRTAVIFSSQRKRWKPNSR